MIRHARRLRDNLAVARNGKGQPVVAPGCFDALSASIVEGAGFDAAYLSGASIAYTRLGRPDIGLVSANEVEDVIALIRDRTPELSLIVDADTGFGNALNVQRTVRSFERAGASAIQLEDQMLPKRCGHLKGKTLVSKGEMVGKVRAALDARNDEDTIVIARTDAIAVEGFDAALERAEAYLEAGADVLFIEAPRTLEQITTIGARFGVRVPLLANMVEGGATPMLPKDELAALGFPLVIFPGAAVRVLVWTLTRFMQDLQANGSSLPWKDRMLDFDGLNEILGTDDMLAVGQRYEMSDSGPLIPDQ